MPWRNGNMVPILPHRYSSISLKNLLTLYIAFIAATTAKSTLFFSPSNGLWSNGNGTLKSSVLIIHIESIDLTYHWSKSQEPQLSIQPLQLPFTSSVPKLKRLFYGRYGSFQKRQNTAIFLIQASSSPTCALHSRTRPPTCFPSHNNNYAFGVSSRTSVIMSIPIGMGKIMPTRLITRATMGPTTRPTTKQWANFCSLAYPFNASPTIASLRTRPRAVVKHSVSAYMPPRSLNSGRVGGSFKLSLPVKKVNFYSFYSSIYADIYCSHYCLLK